LVGPQLLDLSLSVKFRVVVLSHFNTTGSQRDKCCGWIRDSMIVSFLTFMHILPVALLLAKVQTYYSNRY
jgi:hypothetical protein